jgi:tetratricopeptide (TPR) repeat protein
MSSSDQLVSESQRERAFQAALDHCMAQRPADAVTVLRELLVECPRDSRALLVLGSILMDSEPEAAEESLKRCLELAPEDIVALHNLGRLQQRHGNHRAAIGYLRRAADQNPNVASIFNDLGASLHGLGEYSLALAAFDKAIAIDPNDLTAHTKRGLALIELRRPEEALQAVRKGLDDAAPDSVDACHNIATANYLLGNYEAVVVACRQALVLDPLSLVPYSTLIQALDRMHRVEEGHAARVAWARRQGAVVKPCLGKRPLARVLLAGGAAQCNVPTDTLIDRDRFETVTVNLLSPEDGLLDAQIDGACRACDVVFNVIGDADNGAPFLTPANAFYRRLERPILNAPDRIPPTRRDRLPALLGDIAGLVVPMTRRVTQRDLAAEAELALQRGPILLRPIGAHGGDDLVRIECRADIAAYLEAAPAEAYYLSDFYDSRGTDGHFRKYRLIFVDREVFAYHLAIGRDWLLHYWRVDMVDWMRREEEEFLVDYRSVFRGPAADALAEVARRLNLDYAGIDCTLLPDGRVLLFEANATMAVHLADSAGAFGYKHRHVPRIIDAMAQLVLRRMAH